jgi:hypothetical protein
MKNEGILEVSHRKLPNQTCEINYGGYRDFGSGLHGEIDTTYMYG